MTKKLQRLGFCLVFSSLGSSVGYADDDDGEAPLNEVFLSTLVYAQDKGEVQWTFAPGFSQSRNTQQVGLPISFEYGITDALQIELEWGETISIDRLDRASNATEGQFGAGLQYSFMNLGNGNFHAAVGGELELITHRGELDIPGEDENQNEGRTSFTPYAVIAADFKELNDLHLFIHSGVELNREESEIFVSTGAVLSLGETVLSLEWNWTEEQQFLTPGLTLKFDTGWEIGVAAAVGLTDQSDDFRLLANVIYEY